MIVAAILMESAGGSGNRGYVVIVGRRKHDSESVNLGTALIGERVQLQNGRIADGKIVFEVIQQGVNDAACCPSQKARQSWKLDENGLIEEEIQMTVILSLAEYC